MFHARRIEFLFNLSVWIVTACYSLYNVFLFTNKTHKRYTDYEYDFMPGWSFIGRLKDVSDYEWRIWRKFIIFFLQWYFINSIVAHFVRVSKVMSVYNSYALIGLTLVLYKFGLFGLLILISQPVLYYIIVVLGGNAVTIWMTSFSLLTIMNTTKRVYESAEYFYDSEMGNANLYMIMISVSWTNMRCVSYSLDVIKSNKLAHNKSVKSLIQNFIEFLGYIFYLPILFLGPVILYNDFDKSVQVNSNISVLRRILCFAQNNARFLFWSLVLEFSLHFIYFNALIFQKDVISSMPYWPLYGGGLWMGLFFFLKYFIVYGTTGSWAALDNIEPQTPPQCIARVHRYSQMWRYFDVGLYKFLIRYIYQPFLEQFNIGNNNIFYTLLIKSLGSLVCFVFVYCWHGTHHFVLVWSTLNYLGIFMESIGKTLATTNIYVKFKKTILRTPEMSERFEALLTAPILICSALSNFYFFAGYEVGTIYVNRFFSQPYSVTILMFAILFCSCRAGQQLENLRARKIKMH